MKRTILWALIILLLTAGFARAGSTEVEPPFYELKSLAALTLNEDEEAKLALRITYYSGGTVYKGGTETELTGACAMHCASVVLTNRLGKIVTAQEIAEANNAGINKARYWRSFVAWGKLEKAYGVRFFSFDMAQFGTRLKARGVKPEQRRQEKLNAVAAALDEYGQDTGLIIHFNSAKTLNGAGRRHAVVVMGYILKDGVVTDLLVNDSSGNTALRAAYSLKESTLPHSMLGDKIVSSADPDTIPLLLMDCLVSYRWIETSEENNP